MFIQQYSRKNFTIALQEATNDTIGAIEPCFNSTVEAQYI